MLRFAKKIQCISTSPERVRYGELKKLNDFHVETNMTMTTCSFDEISVSNDKKENDNRVKGVSHLE